MRKKSLFFSRFEKTLLMLLGVLFLFSLVSLYSYFFKENSVSIPAQGGVYKEGVVGDPSSLVLNPVFVYGKRDKTPEADISSLIFAGLMKFDSSEGKLKDNIAVHTLSKDKKTYTFTLKEGVRWHDGVEVTVEDILFTFRDVIQHEEFSNESLKRAFKEVKIEKISDSEVSFTITYPYKFFLTNFTIGLLPKHILKDIPVVEMEYSDFSQNPIGNGPFKYVGIEEVRRGIFKLHLNAFRKSSQFSPFLDAVEFYFYPSKSSLSLDSKKLSGIRPFSEIYKNNFRFSDHLKEKSFSLPQYSALFFNMKKPIFDGENGKKIRLALQLASNKKAIIKGNDEDNGIVPAVRIDTPLLETDDEDWLYEFDLDKARGALKDSGFFLPSSKPKTFVPKKSDEKWITIPTENNVWEGERKSYSDEGFSFGGKYPLKVGKVKISLDGEVKIEQDKPKLARTWEFTIPFDEKFQDKTHTLHIEFIGFSNELIAEDSLSFYLEPSSEDTDLEEKDKFEIREDKDGNKLKLTLVTAENPYYYKEVAEYLQHDFGTIGVELEIKTLNMKDFLYTVQHREYDILLYGQNLGYNLDIYEFFHESQIGKDNLSDYQNPKASILIEEIRSSHVQDVRDRKLQELREIFKSDIPAIFLFSPRYLYYYDANIEKLGIRFIAFHKDRFSHIDNAYLLKTESFTDDVSWIDFPRWFTNNFISFITFSL